MTLFSVLAPLVAQKDVFVERGVFVPDGLYGLVDKTPAGGRFAAYPGGALAFSETP